MNFDEFVFDEAEEEDDDDDDDEEGEDDLEEFELLVEDNRFRDCCGGEEEG